MALLLMLRFDDAHARHEPRASADAMSFDDMPMPCAAQARERARYAER